MLAQILTFLAKYSTGIHAAFDLLAMAGGAAALVRAKPIITAIVNRGKLIALVEVKDVRIKELEIERERLQKALEVASSTNDGWEDGFKELSLRISRLDARLTVSTRYIVDLLLYIRRGKWDEKPPTIPDELRGYVTLPEDGAC